MNYLTRLFFLTKLYILSVFIKPTKGIIIVRPLENGTNVFVNGSFSLADLICMKQTLKKFFDDQIPEEAAFLENTLQNWFKQPEA